MIKIVKRSPSNIKYSFENGFKMFVQTGKILKACNTYKLADNHILTDMTCKVFPLTSIECVKTGGTSIAADYRFN